MTTVDLKANAMRAVKLIADFPGYYDLLPRMLEKGGLTYADIGTTKEGVDQMYVAACKAKAKAALEKLLHGCWNDPNFVEYHNRISDWLHRGSLLHRSATKKEARLTYADIGTTKEAVDEVMRELRYLHYYNLSSNFPWYEPAVHIRLW